MGRPEYINIRKDKRIDKSKEAFRNNAFSVLDEAYKLGVRYFDTAPSYGKGESFLNAWNKTKAYNDVVLGTKWGYTYKANWELGYNGKHEVKEHSLNKLNEQWQVSKQMLPKLKYYQVHSATFESGLLENQEVLNRLYQIKKETGIEIGISTSGANQKYVLEAALKVKIDNELLFDVFQVTYNVLEQSTFSVLNTILKNEKTLIIKEALANGRVFQNDNYPIHQRAYKTLKLLSEKYQVGFDAIALRFVIDSLNPTYVLSGASNKIELKENLKALSFRLTEKELGALKNIQKQSRCYWEERSEMNWN